MKERIGKMKNSKKKGFTLIELVVVIAIMAILALIMVPNLTAYINKAEVSKIQANLKNVHTAAELVYQTEGELDFTEIENYANIKVAGASAVAASAEEVDTYGVTETGGVITVEFDGHSFDGTGYDYSTEG